MNNRRQPVKKSNQTLLGSTLTLFTAVLCAQLAGAQTLKQSTPRWWNKYQHLLKNGAESGGGATSSLSVGANVDVSNECGPQSETYVTLNPSQPTILAAGSNEIFRLPMRGYFSSDNGSSWGGDLWGGTATLWRNARSKRRTLTHARPASSCNAIESPRFSSM